MYLADLTTYAPLALCGTALTAKHAEMIRSAPYERLVLLLDGDTAGIRALEKAAAALHDPRTKAVTTRAGHDPASLLTDDGPPALSQALDSARPAADVLLEIHLAKWPDRLDNCEAAIAFLRETSNMIAKIQPHDTAALATRLSHETKLTLGTVTTELTEAVSSFRPVQISRTHHRATPEPLQIGRRERSQTSAGQGVQT